MGVTYLAIDKVLHRRVALKVIDVPAAARSSQAMRERFLREARAAAALRHPNVAGVFQFGASPDASHCYYAMEVVEGETLEARVRRDGPLNAKSALEIAIQITRALMHSGRRSGSRSPDWHHTLAARSKRFAIVKHATICQSSSWSRGKFLNQ